MTKTANVQAIEEATGRKWGDWILFMAKLGAERLPHSEIANRVYDELNGRLDNPGWWAQAVTVAYEQHIGRRAPGQRADGTYEFSLSRTLAGTMDEVFERWLRHVADRTDFNGVLIAKTPTTSQTATRRHWGCGLEGGARLSADVNPKDAGKSILTVTHAKLPSAEEAERWKAYWRSELEAL
jgi:hypothetical protein